MMGGDVGHGHICPYQDGQWIEVNTDLSLNSFN